MNRDDRRLEVLRQVAPGTALRPGLERILRANTGALIVLGSEGAGLRPRVRDACDLLVTIPTAGHVASLNIAVATGLLVFEAVRNAN